MFDLVVIVIEQYGMLESSGWKVEVGIVIFVDGVQGYFYL